MLKKRLHILFLCGWYPSRVLPYNGDFIQRHAETISLLHDVTVLHIISDKNNTQNIEIIHKKKKGVNTFIGYVKKTSNPIIKVYRFYITYKKILQKIGKYDLIHLNELFPFGLFTFLQKKPFIISEHWTGYHYPQSKNIGLAQRLISKRITKRAAFVCPVSKDLQNSMSKIGLQGTYKIVPNVVDTNTFFPLDKKSNNNFTILHVSNMLDTHKNVSGIIRAVSELKFDFKLILIGENSKKYKSLASSLKVSEKIDFINQLPHSKIPTYLQEANVYVSFSNYETWGIVMVEAIACGTPVISTKTGILNELNKIEHTTIIDIKDENALTKSIENIQKESLVNKNQMYKFVEDNFSTVKIAEKFDKLYQIVLQ